MDAIVGTTTPGIQAAQQATRTTSIVIASSPRDGTSPRVNPGTARGPGLSVPDAALVRADHGVR